MKKTIIGLSAVLISVFVLIMAVNAQDNTQENKKTSTEVKKNCPKGPNASGCCNMKYGSSEAAKSCEKASCKEKGCDPSKCKDAKCGNATACKSNCTKTSGQGKKCDQAGLKSSSPN